MIVTAGLRKTESQYLEWGSYRHGYINIGVAGIERMVKSNLAAIKLCSFGDFMEVRNSSC
jgi:hypothetical protein